jgi:di/tricarboxylate transporter
VAGLGLVAATATGIVPMDEAFRGFSDDVVIIVGSALVVSAAVARSGVPERLMRPLEPFLTSSERQIAVLVAVVAVLSAFMKNIGALAIVMPVAFQLSRRHNQPPSRVLMPLSFGALLGGLITLIGTSPNIVVSRVRLETMGAPFSMFDFAPVGLVLAAAGTLFLVFGWRLLPQNRKAAAAPEELFSVQGYQAEVLLPEGSPFAGKTVRELEESGEGDVSVAAVIREEFRRYVPAAHWTLYAGDILVLQCDAHALSRIVGEAKLTIVGDKKIDEEPADLTVIEAVVTGGASIIGQTLERLRLRDRYGINVLALNRSQGTATARLRRTVIKAGDILVLRLRATDMADHLAALGLLPLAERRVRLDPGPHPLIAVGVLALAILAATTGLASVAVSFFAAAVIIVALGGLTLKEAYEAVDWPILILLGALIPVSSALATTGGAGLVAGWLEHVANLVPATVAIGLLMAFAMAVTPFLNNAATVLLVAPIAVGLAQRLNLNPDAFLMAVAIGAACDFLTPIGHQCNTLVMGPGGYRFGDYWRLGLPLSIIILLLGTPLVAFIWAR